MCSLPTSVWSGSRLFGKLLGDLLFQQARALRQFVVAGLGPPRIQAAALLAGAQGLRRNTHPIALAHRLRLQGHMAQIGQKPAFAAVIGVADIVAGHHRFVGQFTRAGHPSYLFRVFFGPNRVPGAADWLCTGGVERPDGKVAVH